MLPCEIAAAIKESFSNERVEILCQVCTIAETKPHVRTMNLYDITDDGALVFLTARSTQKWLDLTENNACAVCFFSIIFGQLIAEGMAHLSTATEGREITQKYWHMMPPMWREYYDAGSKVFDIPDSFGVICVLPHRWEVLENNKDNYQLSTRREFMKTDASWPRKIFL